MASMEKSDFSVIGLVERHQILRSEFKTTFNG